MFLHIQNVLTPEEIAFFRQSLGADAPWVDGERSAGGQALYQKNNLQLSQGSALSAQLQARVKEALHRNALFFSAALPRRIFNPLFNNYGDGANFYGNHVDSAVMHSKADNCWVRSDLSCTLFLTPPEDYDGGELVITEALGEKRIKLPAGDMVLYPSSTVHQVSPVTRGHRISSFFWVESMVRGLEQRQLLFDMDMSLLKLRQAHGEKEPSVIALSGTYHNLLRMWADV
ncbi:MULTISPECIES: Fe2+-dependent dioxygenase [unclassified Acidovorax]|uniref:Fe2+-dependent dioxygenase n=1 Tax=unclassified Acidovorax TaxID=2684926 RepID=UPI000B406854|nr:MULTISPECIES: Fe2+-dependent dioxygenase [unclassified Acidovorax]MBP3982601.1 Fe2+-dependent dioxygenase [Acidovorax sp. JG5]